MTQIVGLFIGGTGQYVAELLKGWSQEYNWDFDKYTVFDVDTNEVLRGPFELGDDLVPPPNGFRPLVEQAINEWASDEVGRDAAAGARPYEASVLYNTARGLKRELLSPTSGLWTLRSTGLPATEALHRAAAGQDPVARGVRLASELVQENDTENVQLVVVGSSAGGTGSGFAIPFALQARRGFGPAPIEIVSLMAGASAFENTWDSRDVSTRSRGTSGTFAVFREIDFLSAKPEEYATPGRREVPVAGGIRYFVDNGVQLRPDAAVAGYQLARSAYWLGRRSTLDTVSTAQNCMQELARFYAAMSDPKLATMINGKPVMQSSPLALTPGLVSIEYRRLEVAERVAGDLLVYTIDNEILGTGVAVASANASYFILPPQQDEADISVPYAAFARDIKPQVFTNPGDVTAGRITPKQFQTFITSLAPETTMTSVAPPTDIERRLPAADWADTKTQLITRMNNRLEELDRKQHGEIDREVAAEISRVADRSQDYYCFDKPFRLQAPGDYELAGLLKVGTNAFASGTTPVKVISPPPPKLRVENLENDRETVTLAVTKPCCPMEIGKASSVDFRVTLGNSEIEQEPYRLSRWLKVPDGVNGLLTINLEGCEAPDLCEIQRPFTFPANLGVADVHVELPPKWRDTSKLTTQASLSILYLDGGPGQVTSEPTTLDLERPAWDSALQGSRAGYWVPFLILVVLLMAISLADVRLGRPLGPGYAYSQMAAWRSSSAADYVGIVHWKGLMVWHRFPATARAKSVILARALLIAGPLTLRGRPDVEDEPEETPAKARQQDEFLEQSPFGGFTDTLGDVIRTIRAYVFGTPARNGGGEGSLEFTDPPASEDDAIVVGPDPDLPY